MNKFIAILIAGLFATSVNAQTQSGASSTAGQSSTATMTTDDKAAAKA
ncbi:MAG: hypothetical protein V7642_5096, partial [Burkholderiales bacterium]